MRLDFGGEIWFWRGPSPFHFVTIPEPESAALNEIAGVVSYGWGVVPVEAHLGHTSWATSLTPKNGGYLVPLKESVRAAEGLEVGDYVDISVIVSVSY